MLAERRRRRNIRHQVLLEISERWNQALLLYFNIIMLTYHHQVSRPISRRCRRVDRVQGWWQIVWYSFDEKRFKMNFRITKATFLYVFKQLEDLLTKEAISEEPIPQ